MSLLANASVASPDLTMESAAAAATEYRSATSPFGQVLGDLRAERSHEWEPASAARAPCRGRRRLRRGSRLGPRFRLRIALFPPHGTVLPRWLRRRGSLRRRRRNRSNATPRRLGTGPLVALALRLRLRPARRLLGRAHRQPADRVDALLDAVRRPSAQRQAAGHRRRPHESGPSLRRHLETSEQSTARLP